MIWQAERVTTDLGATQWIMHFNMVVCVSTVQYVISVHSLLQVKLFYDVKI